VERAMRAFTTELQRITTHWPVIISHPIESRRLSVGLDGWLRYRGGMTPKTVTHPSTNRVQRRVTLMMCLLPNCRIYCFSECWWLSMHVTVFWWFWCKLLGCDETMTVHCQTDRTSCAMFDVFHINYQQECQITVF